MLETKPLFHPEVIRQQLQAFTPPDRLQQYQPKLKHWADLIASGRADQFKETALLPDFLNDIFCGLLGYTGPAASPDTFTLSRETTIEVDGQRADAVLGRFGQKDHRFIAVLEGKGTRDPLDRPFSGRPMSAVDQAYRYAINLPCDWITVTSMRETRLYHKGSQQNAFERFETVRLASDPVLLKRFVFLLGAERVVPPQQDCHFDELLRASEHVGRQLTNQFYALYSDIRQRVLTRLCRENAAIAPAQILRCTQKLLDRVLFCAFCEDRALLPAESLKRAYEHRDPYNPRPVWHNFRSLFRAIDEGSSALSIPAYNGGLFAPDPLLDGLTVPDEVCVHFRDLGDFDYRPSRQIADANEDTHARPVIDVDILGHIFEQSITDLERLRLTLESTIPSADAPEPRRGNPIIAQGKAAADATLGTAPDNTSSLSPSGGERAGVRGSLESLASSRRKQEGAFYTPAFITRYIVEQALGGVLKQRFEALRQRHQTETAGTARKALGDPNAYDLAALNEPQRKALIRFWEAWQEELKSLRILDPSCGSGAFLIEAFDQLHTVFDKSNARLEELRGQRTLFDLDRQILQNNLYGVDLNAEAIQICQLSLWIKTAARGKRLTSLDHTICEGNSVISDPAVHPKAFNWQAAFPEVFAQGGFDVVVGNPPYIRQELLKDYKPHWERRFKEVYSGTADIYVYFYSLALEVLRPDGHLAFISSNAFARANYASRLRSHLLTKGHLLQFIDLGDTQVFQDAKDVYPALVVVAKPGPATRPHTDSIKTIRLRRTDDPSLLSELVESGAWTVPTSRLTDTPWQFDQPEIVRLREKLHNGGIKLGQRVQGRIYFGIKTGLNDAFVITDQQRAEMVSADPKSAERTVRFVGGQELRRWHHEDSGRWLILFPNGFTTSSLGTTDEKEAKHLLAEKYPPIFTHLCRFEEAAKRRTDKGSFWWELRPCDYYEAFARPKILYPDIAKSNRFHMADAGVYASNTAYMLPFEDFFLLGVLNTKAVWFALAGISTPFGERAGELRYRLFTQFIEQLPIPDAQDTARSAIASLAQTSGTLARDRYSLQVAVQRRLLQTFCPDASGQLNQRAQAWWDLPLAQLGDALKQSFKLRASPMKNPKTADEWEPYITEKQAENTRLTRALADTEAELNDRVCRLFDLTPLEIKLLQKEVQH